jgi:hypothetical protein
VTAACIPVFTGVDLDEAWRRSSQARGLAVPETAKQRAWVERFASTAEATSG